MYPWFGLGLANLTLTLTLPLGLALALALTLTSDPLTPNLCCGEQEEEGGALAHAVEAEGVAAHGERGGRGQQREQQRAPGWG